MRTVRRATGWALTALVLAAVVAEPASAVPAFARKYRTSCNTCRR